MSEHATLLRDSAGFESLLDDHDYRLDYATLKARLPAGVEPGYDGWSADLTI